MGMEAHLPQGLQQVLETVEALPEEKQWMVEEIIANRLRRLCRLRRQQLIEEVEEARSAYRRGEVRRGSVDDLLRELDE